MLKTFFIIHNQKKNQLEHDQTLRKSKETDIS